MDNEGRGEKPGFVSVVFAVFACAARFLDDSRIKSVNYKDTRGTAMVFYERWGVYHVEAGGMFISII